MEAENDLWKDVLDFISERLNRPSYETWFKSTKLKKEENTWIIIIPNEFAREWMERRYLPS